MAGKISPQYGSKKLFSVELLSLSLLSSSSIPQKFAKICKPEITDRSDNQSEYVYCSLLWSISVLLLATCNLFRTKQLTSASSPSSSSASASSTPSLTSSPYLPSSFICPSPSSSPPEIPSDSS